MTNHTPSSTDPVSLSLTPEQLADFMYTAAVQARDTSLLRLGGKPIGTALNELAEFLAGELIKKHQSPHEPETGFIARLRAAINHELPRSHKGFRSQYDQDAVMRALDRAFASVPMPGDDGPGEEDGPWAEGWEQRRSPEPCRIPPAGWRCIRAAGHEGPCAAVEVLTEEWCLSMAAREDGRSIAAGSPGEPDGELSQLRRIDKAARNYICAVESHGVVKARPALRFLEQALFDGSPPTKRDGA
ncbi:MAG: hypothetical protein QM813_17085 [Verrucomicrobiota bacterium]